MEAIKRQIAEAKNQLVKDEAANSVTVRDIRIKKAEVEDREQAVGILTATTNALFMKTSSQAEEMNALERLNNTLQEKKTSSLNEISRHTDKRNALYAEDIVIVEEIKSLETKIIALWEENRETKQSISEKTYQNEQLRNKISECRA